MKVLKMDLDPNDQQFWRIDPVISGGGHFMERCCHIMDTLAFILGPIETASGTSANLAGLYSSPDCVSAWFRFACGALGSGNFSFCAGENRDLVTIAGEKGSISFPIMAANQATLNLFGQEPQQLHFDVPKHVQQPFITDVVNALTLGTLCPSTGRTAQETMRIMELMMGRDPMR